MTNPCRRHFQRVTAAVAAAAVAGPAMTMEGATVYELHLAKLQLRARGQFGKAGQSRAQTPGVVAPGLDTRSLLRIGGQPRVDFSEAHRVEALVDIGVQLVLGGGQACHFNLRRAGDAGLPSVSWRNAARARDKRDITVPIGIAKASAASL